MGVQGVHFMHFVLQNGGRDPGPTSILLVNGGTSDFPWVTIPCSIAFVAL